MKSTIRNLQSSISNLVSRGTVSGVDATGKMQRIQGSILAGENKGGLEHFEPYGFTSNPVPGAEFVPVFLEGDRSHGVVIVAADRRYRVTGLPAGGIAIGTPGNSIIFNPDGTITLSTATLTINAPHINSAGTWAHTGELTANGKSLPHHVHVDPQGGSTAQPT